MLSAGIAKILQKGLQGRLPSSGHVDGIQGKLLETCHNRTGTAAAAQHECGSPLPCLGSGLQRRQKTFGICVVTVPVAVVSRNQRVHGLKPSGQWTEFRAVSGNRLLVRDGHIQAAAVHGSQTGQDALQIRLGTGKSEIAPVEAHGVEGGVVHHR